MLATEDIEMAASNNDCAHRAIINLFKLRGLKPPTFDEVSESLYAAARATRGREIVGDPEAPTLLEIQTVLAIRGLLCGLVLVPPAFWNEPQKMLTGFLDDGCHLIIFFNWRDPNTKEIVTHTTLCEGYDEHGYKVIDGEPGFFPEGKMVELEPSALSEEQMKDIERWLETHSHGSRMTLPFYSVFLLPTQPLGLMPHVLVVYSR